MNCNVKHAYTARDLALVICLEDAFSPSGAERQAPHFPGECALPFLSVRPRAFRAAAKRRPMCCPRRWMPCNQTAVGFSDIQ
jgi:hypothetical protein